MVEDLAPQFQAAEKLLSRYEDEPEHVRQVSRLAGEVFDGLGAAGGHPYGAEEREWLILGGLLHDIGWSQTPTGSGHHKWSARLIEKHGIEGYQDRETRMVALIARYHRKSLPDPEKSSHEPFFRLDAEDQERIRLLGGIVRVADALDRTHCQLVRHVGVRLKPDGCALLVSASHAFGPEKATVQKKGDLLSLYLDRPVWAEPA
ncbi:MAG: HD domain-containing protein [Verrucomicrobiota bacterium]